MIDRNWSRRDLERAWSRMQRRTARWSRRHVPGTWWQRNPPPFTERVRDRVHHAQARARDRMHHAQARVHHAQARARERLDDAEVDPALLAAGAAAGALLVACAIRHFRLPSWEGRVALVTGASRGFGLLIARELAAEGCELVICARDEAELERAAQDLRSRGAEVLAVRCDVTDEDDVGRMVDRAVERFGRIDVLVNNAGAIGVGPVTSMTSEDFRRAHDVIAAGAIHCTLAALPHMLRTGGGHVVNVSSLGGRIAMPHMVPYDSAKFALTGFSEGLRAELGQRGVCVTTVFPGTMRTGSYRRADFKGRSESEYAWFALASALPFMSTSAEHAARAVVRGARRGQAEVVVPLYAKVLTRLHGLAPATAGAVAAALARWLPDPSEQDAEFVEGRVVEARLPERRRIWLDRLTALGRHAGQRTLQEPRSAAHEPGRARVSAEGRIVGGLAGGALLVEGLRRGGALGAAVGVFGGLLLGGATFMRRSEEPAGNGFRQLAQVSR